MSFMYLSPLVLVINERISSRRMFYNYIMFIII